MANTSRDLHHSFYQNFNEAVSIRATWMKMNDAVKTQVMYPDDELSLIERIEMGYIVSEIMKICPQSDQRKRCAKAIFSGQNPYAADKSNVDGRSSDKKSEEDRLAAFVQHAIHYKSDKTQRKAGGDKKQAFIIFMLQKLAHSEVTYQMKDETIGERKEGSRLAIAALAQLLHEPYFQEDPALPLTLNVGQSQEYNVLMNSFILKAGTLSSSAADLLTPEQKRVLDYMAYFVAQAVKTPEELAKFKAGKKKQMDQKLTGFSQIHETYMQYCLQRSAVLLDKMRGGIVNQNRQLIRG